MQQSWAAEVADGAATASSSAGSSAVLRPDLEGPAGPAASLDRIEQSAVAVAEDVASLVLGLQSALQELSHGTVEYMGVYRGTAEHVMQSVGHSVAHGRSFIDKCVRLDAQMAQVDVLAAQVKEVKASLAQLEGALGVV